MRAGAGRAEGLTDVVVCATGAVARSPKDARVDGEVGVSHERKRLLWGKKERKKKNRKHVVGGGQGF